MRTLAQFALAAACGTCALAAPVAPAPPVPPAEAVTPDAQRPTVERDRLVEFIKALPQARSPMGDQAHQDGLRRAEALVRDRLVALGLTPVEQPFPWRPRPTRPTQTPGEAVPAAPPEPAPEQTWHNYIVEFPGTDLADEVLVLGAHFDAVPNSPGADDNATGAAALMELARVLKDVPRRRTLRLCFFNLEEVGLVGSRAYVQSLSPAERARVVGMVSLEMLGYYSDKPGSQQSPIPPIEGVWDPPTVGDTIAVVGLARDRAFSQPLMAAMRDAEPALKITPVDFLPVPVPDMMRSDHAPFVHSGLAGFMLTDTANFRNPHYHTPGDTLDTLDLARYELVVRALAGAATSLGNAESWKPAPAEAPPPGVRGR
ncbi:MAG: M20/M25/M40 family metallo-hydrolase [Planctomycetota bacterium]|nr:M20/M25/M40 family metallo-hydrolase [Planctomycetota bacterium]